MPIADSKREENHFFKKTPVLRRIGMMPIFPKGFQHLPSQPGVFSVMQRMRSVVIFWIKFFQRLRLGLWIDKDETAFFALYNSKLTRDSKHPVPSFKKKVMFIRPTQVTSNVLHESNQSSVAIINYPRPSLFLFEHAFSSPSSLPPLHLSPHFLDGSLVTLDCSRLGKSAPFFRRRGLLGRDPYPLRSF